MTHTDWTNPDCDIIDALTYVRGNRRADNLPTTQCGGGPVRLVRIRGEPTHQSVVPGAPVQGPIGSFRLCQEHRREPPIRDAKLEPSAE